jgi:transposase
MSKKKPVLLSREEKLAYVEQILLKKKTVLEVANATGVHETTVYDWLKKYRDNPSDSLPGSGNLKKSDKEIKDLEKRIKELEKENEFLKKAAAYFVKNPM